MDISRDSSFALLAAAIFAAPGALLGCAAGPAPEGAGDEPALDGDEHAAEEHIQGTLVYKLALTPDHTISFYQMDVGHRAFREAMPVGTEEPVLNRLPDGPVSLAAIYRQARPGAEVPADVLEVDALYPPDAADDVAEVSPTAETTTEEVTAHGAADLFPTAALGAAAVCTGDLLNDNFGAQWFLDMFCVGGNDRWCQTNRGSGFIERTSRLVRWSVMGADFNAGGYIKQQWRCRHTKDSDGIMQWSVPRREYVPARTVTTWIIDEGGWRCGDGVCGQPVATVKNWAEPNENCARLHYAARWM